MKGIGGNLTAIIEKRTVTKNEIGEHIESWQEAARLRGWLDLASGDSRYTVFSAKVQQSTHVFIADYKPLPDDVTAENARVTIAGKRYDVMLIDNPMELGAGSQLEIYLKYTGGTVIWRMSSLTI